MGMFGDRLRQVFRRLARTPLFTALTLITLAVGIGATTLIFSVVDGVLLKPLPYPHSEQLIGIWHKANVTGLEDLEMTPSFYFIDRDQNKTLEDIGAYSGDSLSVTGVGEPEHVGGLDVTDGVLHAALTISSTTRAVAPGRASVRALLANCRSRARSHWRAGRRGS